MCLRFFVPQPEWMKFNMQYFTKSQTVPSPAMSIPCWPSARVLRIHPPIPHPSFQPAFASCLFLGSEFCTLLPLLLLWDGIHPLPLWSSLLVAPLASTIPLVSDPNCGSQPKPREPHPCCNWWWRDWLSSGLCCFVFYCSLFLALVWFMQGHVPSKIASEAQAVSLNVRRPDVSKTQKFWSCS